MKIRIDDITQYKKIIAAICSVPSARKQLNSVEQCIELKTNKEENVLEITTVDLSSHAIKLRMPAEILEEGRQIVLSNKIKAMTSKLNPKYGVEILSKDNLLHYEMRPYGSIVDNQYFSQDSLLSNDFFEEDSYSEISSELFLFLGLIPIACANTYNDREIYVTTSANSIQLYVQFTETSYIRYKSVTTTRATADFKGAIRPALLRIIHHLGEKVTLAYSKKYNTLKFHSDTGTMCFIVDSAVNNIVRKVDAIVANDADAYVQVAHEDFTESIKWQSYDTTETNIVNLDFDAEEEQFIIQVNSTKTKQNKPSLLDVEYSGLFEKLNISVGHITKALKAMGTPKNKILPIEIVKVNIKKIAIKNADPINVIHLCSHKEDDVTSDVIIYEANC
jgi:hypothetical protein